MKGSGGHLSESHLKSYYLMDRTHTGLSGRDSQWQVTYWVLYYTTPKRCSFPKEGTCQSIAHSQFQYPRHSHTWSTLFFLRNPITKCTTLWCVPPLPILVSFIFSTAFWQQCVEGMSLRFPSSSHTFLGWKLYRYWLRLSIFCPLPHIYLSLGLPWSIFAFFLELPGGFLRGVVTWT